MVIFFIKFITLEEKSKIFSVDTCVSRDLLRKQIVIKCLHTANDYFRISIKNVFFHS